jgi:hypothetical protein
VNLKYRIASTLGVALFLTAVPAARANSYSFNFTTNDALNILAASDPYYLVEGYYAFFLQP